MPQELISGLVCRPLVCVHEKYRFLFMQPLQCLFRENNSFPTAWWSTEEHILSVALDHISLLFVKPQSLVFLSCVVDCLREALHIFVVAETATEL